VTYNNAAFDAKEICLKLRLKVLAIAAVFASDVAHAQELPPWHDDLIDNLAGTWKVEDEPAEHQSDRQEMQAEWVSNHSLLQMRPRTDAESWDTWTFGYDSDSHRYVLYLFPVPGFDTPGYGNRDGNSIRYEFEYPGGGLHITFRWLPETDSWQWSRERKNKDGKWTRLPDLKLVRVPKT
jgi:hypothetical protein